MEVRIVVKANSWKIHISFDNNLRSLRRLLSILQEKSSSTRGRFQISACFPKFTSKFHMNYLHYPIFRKEISFPHVDIIYSRFFEAEVKRYFEMGDDLPCNFLDDLISLAINETTNCQTDVVRRGTENLTVLVNGFHPLVDVSNRSTLPWWHILTHSDIYVSTFRHIWDRCASFTGLRMYGVYNIPFSFFFSYQKKEWTVIEFLTLPEAYM